MHRHTPATTTDSPYRGPVTASRGAQNPAAHGNITRREVCSCGCTRLVNLNGRHRETSSWT